jgi:hypothetical protein
MAGQAPIKVSGQTKERIRHRAGGRHAGGDSGRAGEEYAARHADAIAEGIERARRVLGGDAAIASHLLGVPAEDVQGMAGLSGTKRPNAGPASPSPTTRCGPWASPRTPRRSHLIPGVQAADRTKKDAPTLPPSTGRLIVRAGALRGRRFRRASGSARWQWGPAHRGGSDRRG